MQIAPCCLCHRERQKRLQTLLNVPGEGGSLCLRTTGSEQINRLIIPKTSRPFPRREGGDREGSRKLQAKGRVILREEAKPGQICVCLGSKDRLIRGHLLMEWLITDSGITAPKLPLCHCSLQQLPFESCFCFLPSLKRLVNEVTKINGY